MLLTSDNQQFSVDKVVVQRSALIKSFLEGGISTFAALDSAQLLNSSFAMF
jgi:hypothetical protein